MRRTCLMFALCAPLLGCAAGQSRVKGRLVENGQPFPVEGQAALLLYPSTPDGKGGGKAYVMGLNPDGSFELVASGGEVAPGDYLVTLEVNGPKSASGIGKYKGLFALGAKPMQRTLKPGSNDLTIDLAKPE